MKHNCVYLYGIVKSEPKKIKIENEQHLMCEVEVVKGNRYYGNPIGKNRPDTVPVIAFNEKNITEMSSWQIGDIVDIKGYASVTNLYATPKCSHCNADNEQTVPFFFVCPIYSEMRLKQPSKTQTNEYMTNHKEVSNQITIGGMLVTPAQEYCSKEGVQTTIFDIQTDVKYNFEETQKEYHIFPVKNFGFNAKIAKDLQKSDLVFVDGFLSKRKNKHNCTCKSCNKSFNWSDNGVEIASLSLEFFN